MAIIDTQFVRNYIMKIKYNGLVFFPPSNLMENSFFTQSTNLCNSTLLVSEEHPMDYRELRHYWFVFSMHLFGCKL